MNEIYQSFTKGINRTVSREEFFDPEQFYSVVNARLLQRGNIGQVKRIAGYTEFTTALSDLSILYDMITYNNLFVVFYKNTSGQYCIRILDKTATPQDTFTYTDDLDPEWGELKQYDNTIFVAPHNKVVYDNKGSYTLEDFVSNIPRIKSITSDEDALKAKYNLTVENTLSEGYKGSKGVGRISFGGGSLEPNLEYSFRIQIGNISTDLISGTFPSNEELITAIWTKLNETTALTDIYDFSLVDSFAGLSYISITTKTNTSTYNGTEISVTDTDTLTYYTASGNFSEDALTFRNLVFRTINGGAETNTVFGSVNLAIKDAVVTRSIEISETDSTSDIADNLETILKSEKKITDQYNISRSTNVVIIEAIKAGKEFNTNISVDFNKYGSSNVNQPNKLTNLTQVREGRDTTTTGTILPNTKYWYKARFRFVDGHITRTCSPALVDSGPVNPISVIFDIPVNDLDGTYPRLQIYRKEDSGEFFLIEEVNLDEVTISSNEFVYVDDGLSEISALEEVENVWTSKHKTQEIVDNRYVKGNIEYYSDDVTFGESNFTLQKLQLTGDDKKTIKDVAPINSKLTMYAQPQYADGSLGFFNRIGDIDIPSGEDSSLIQVKQDSLITNNDKNISEINFYGRYLPFGQKENLRFTTPEIINSNISAIEDPQLFSTIPQILFGYKYMLTIERVNVETFIGEGVYTRIKPWSDGESDNFNTKFDGYRRVASLNSDAATIETINVDGVSQERLRLYVHNEQFTYVPKVVFDPNSSNAINGKQIIWELEVYEPLKEAISTGSLQIQLKDTNKDTLSRVVDDDTLTELKVPVVGFDDKTNAIESWNFVPIVGAGGVTAKILTLPEDCRLFLNVKSEEYDEIDNQTINNRNYFIEEGDGIEPLNLFGGSVGFDLLNFQEKDVSSIDSDPANLIEQFGEQGESYFLYPRIKNAIYYLINRNLTVENNTIYLGSKPNEVNYSYTTLDTTGFRFRTRSNLLYSTLAPYNIYSVILKESDFNFRRETFKNQIIWSSPLLQNNYFSGGRNFAIASFYDLPSENGEILEIVSLGGNLYAFCERGVARLFVGEVLTQQKSGNVFVDSSGFITKHVWLFENTSTINKQSIVKYEGAIYFCDGTDVYKITGNGLENITQTVLNLDETHEFSANVVRKFDEYRLVDETANEMFVYNTKFGVWYGPHTYEPRKTQQVDDVIVSYIGDGLKQEETGSTFDGTPYTTIVQSVGNDTDIGTVDKTYRKFYFSVDGEKDVDGRLTNTTFKYGRDTADMESVPLDSNTKTIIKNGWYNVGVSNLKGNARKLYWDMESTNPDFIIDGLELNYVVRKRR